MMSSRQSKGFTLVELMLSMAFVSLLLLAIALLVIQISNMYNKGLTLRAVNESGQLIASDLQETLNTSVPSAAPLSPHYVSSSGGGRLCVGTTVYAWNYDSSIKNPIANPPFNKYQDSSYDIRFVRFSSGGTDYCSLSIGPGPATYPSIPNSATSLITAGDSNLALHSFSFTSNQLAIDARQYIYEMNMTIGTSQTGIISAGECTVPQGIVDDTYCAVNDFTFMARSGNRQ
jgi:type II secretory pathway pseudopilin PulG